MTPVGHGWFKRYSNFAKNPINFRVYSPSLVETPPWVRNAFHHSEFLEWNASNWVGKIQTYYYLWLMTPENVPWKINMEPKTQPIEKANHLNQTMISRFHVNLPWCTNLFNKKNNSSGLRITPNLDNPTFNQTSQHIQSMVYLSTFNP